MLEKPSTLFITGTDTGCGKTRVTALLARRLAGAGLRVACFKPIASGCERVEDRLVNDDARILMRAMNVELDYETVNRYALEAAIAPHIAAEKAGIGFDLDAICSDIAAVDADLRLVEGVGGWRVPLDGGRFLGDLPARLGCPVLLVVGMRLGCLNHALLTAEAVRRDGFELLGWIANYLDPDFEEPDANERTLDAHMPAPRVGRVTPHGGEPRLELSGRLERLFG